MKKNTKNIFFDINLFIEEFTRMDIGGTVINCPYWMNKIVDGQVKLRGFQQGKGTAFQIRQELIKRLQAQYGDTHVRKNPQFLQKFAKRERIGIDCSGFAFQVLDKLVQLNYRNCVAKNLTQVFPDGINRTNAKTLTSRKYCLPIQKITQCQLGDLIKMMGGKHVAVILEITPAFLTYIHADRFGAKQGVHQGKIKITDKTAGLEKQNWLEKTRKGDDFGKKYFNPQRKDGIYRLKIFA